MPRFLLTQLFMLRLATSCEQPPAQSVKDRAAYSDQELGQFGLLPRPTSAGRYADWVASVRAAKTRHCDQTVTNVTNSHDLQTSVWGGNIADESTSGQIYGQVYAIFYVPCLAGNFSGASASWVGIGGLYNANLVQTGVQETRYQDWLGRWVSSYEAWVENLGDSGNPNENAVFGVNCGDKMQVEVYGKYFNRDCMYIDDMTTNDYGTWCYGPAYNTSSAEAIVEHPYVNNSQVPLADFQSETFYSVLIVNNGVDYAMDQVPHDYSYIWSQNLDHTLTSLSSITYDYGTAWPYDKYTQTWYTSQ